MGADEKAVNRGFATTSVASKKKIEEPTEADIVAEQGVAKNGDNDDSKRSDGAIGLVTQPGQANRGSIKEDWEDEALAEQVALQALVDRLHEKGEKEVSRVVKVSQ